MSDLQNVIWSLGMYNTYKGYGQLVVAVEIARKDTESLLHVTKLLYPAVAAATHSSPYCVERNLRTVVTACWERGNRSRLNELCGYRTIDKPTAKEFIGILVAYLDRCEQEA